MTETWLSLEVCDHTRILKTNEGNSTTHNPLRPGFAATTKEVTQNQTHTHTHTETVQNTDAQVFKKL